jgi:hypothetical protein
MYPLDGDPEPFVEGAGGRTRGRTGRVGKICICVCVCVSRIDEVTGDWRRLHNEELNDL